VPQCALPARGRWAITIIQEYWAAILAQLASHSAFEEKLMAFYKYPLAKVHAAEHKSIYSQFDAIFHGVNSQIVSRTSSATLLKKVVRHHDKYHDSIFWHYVNDRYFFQSVEDGGGI
jgi:hemerythrin